MFIVETKEIKMSQLLVSFSVSLIIFGKVFSIEFNISSFYYEYIFLGRTDAYVRVY